MIPLYGNDRLRAGTAFVVERVVAASFHAHMPTAPAMSYWVGNAAKGRVIGSLIAEAERHPDEFVIFDHGCGEAGDWPDVLRDHPRLRLLAWDPETSRAERARARLAGNNAEVVTPERVERLAGVAHAVVSFSVLEHVRDRLGYLRTARRILRPDGTFHLNYDDGHFRIAFDVDEWREWPAHTRQLLHNVLARLLGVRYQRRVTRAEADRLVQKAGFECIDVRYENLSAFKLLSQQLSASERAAFATFWSRVETDLQRFGAAGPSRRGDTHALWTVMASRTMILRPA
jgi:SAM-dependent methyltransferase